MDPLREEEEGISQEFLRKLTDDVIKRLGEKFDELGFSLTDIDTSIDFLGALIADVDPASMRGLQRSRHRLVKPRDSRDRDDDRERGRSGD